jgi:hypothetical protein
MPVGKWPGRPPYCRTQVCRAAKSHNDNVDPAAYQIDQRILKKDRKPRLCDVYLIHALQFRAHPPDASRHPGDGSWRDDQALGPYRYGTSDRRARGSSIWQALNWLEHAANRYR